MICGAAVCLGAGCAGDGPTSGRYGGWFEDPVFEEVPVHSEPVFQVDLDGDEVVFELLDPSRAFCSYSAGSALTVDYFSQPQSFESASAIVEEGEFTMTASVDLFGRAAGIEISGQWVDDDRIVGELVSDDSPACRADWEACHEAAECPGAVCESEGTQDATCDWMADERNCWHMTIASLEACLPDDHGDLSSDGSYCDLDDGTRVVFSPALPLNDDLDEDYISFEVQRGGSTCFSFESEREGFDTRFELETGFGSFVFELGMYESEDPATDIPVDWTCPDGCVYHGNLWDFWNGCDDELFPGAWLDYDYSDGEVNFKVGSEEGPLGVGGGEMRELFTCD